MMASIVIRTYNEGRYLGELLAGIRQQRIEGMEVETIVVDSGSTDSTVSIATAAGCRIVHISKEDFSFGRSLNVGCEAARGEVLAFLSGHCVPVDDQWLARLVHPLANGIAALTYGRQIGGPRTRFSEHEIFAKYFPPVSKIPQEGFFCNNANAATLRSMWSRLRYNESLTGLEDMEYGKRLVLSGEKVAYVADSVVYHHHHESWQKVRSRYEREALALQHIMPEMHLSVLDVARYISGAVLRDSAAAVEGGRLWQSLPEIVMFRTMQYWGSYRGNHESRQVSKRQKELYFYPR